MPRQNVSFRFKGRQVSLHPDVAYAIRDICAEFISLSPDPQGVSEFELINAQFLYRELYNCLK